MRAFTVIRRIAIALNGRSNAVIEKFSWWLSDVLSWPIWTPLILLASTLGYALHLYDALVYIMTVQTSLDTAATKTVQKILRTMEDRRIAIESEREEKWRAATQAQLDDMRSVVDDVKSLAEALTEKDAAILAALNHLVERS